MTEEVFSEKLSIRNSARSLKKYGSTSSHTIQNVNLVKHLVSSGDTLQGIALRYGVTTEQIRRTNRLWATDSLFLREYLLIPVSCDGVSAGPGSPGTNFHPVPDLTRTNSVPLDTDQDNINEFLGKIDTSIAIMKNEVKKCQGNSEFVSEMGELLERRRPATSRLRQPGPLAPPDASRKVRNSLQNIARQQDELFEL